jgi:probable rRNA maturation factor
VPGEIQDFPHVLGDVALAFETIDRESKAQGLTLEDHLTHLIVHGFLHLIGFDHAKNDEADRMEGLEAAILGGLGIKDPYRAPGA